METSDATLLAIDVGNSRTKFGAFAAAATAGGWPVFQQRLAVPHGEAIPWDVVRAWAPAFRIVAAGVQPQRLTEVAAACRQAGLGEPRIIRGAADLPLTVALPHPERVGVDRLLNAVAANAVRPAETRMILVDSGTATTVDLVDEHGAFAGGAILPGLELSAKALHQYTALLPQIAEAEFEETPAALGVDTRAALRSGLFWGQVGAIRELTARLTAGSPLPTRILLTGGAAARLHPQLPAAVWVPDLPLLGLAAADGGSG